jgi:hypothetical protein
VPISPGTQKEVEATIRTAPVELLTQAKIFDDTGPAMAAVLARSVTARTPTYLSEDIESSRYGGKHSDSVVWCAANEYTS